jgi:hypothetical protein
VEREQPLVGQHDGNAPELERLEEAVGPETASARNQTERRVRHQLLVVVTKERERERQDDGEDDTLSYLSYSASSVSHLSSLRSRHFFP